MALSATMHRFQIALSDVDRGVYETLEFPLARHPSESESYAVVRVLAYALEYCQDIAFGRGVGEGDDPGLSAPGMHGTTALWIDIGAPSAERLHKAAKHADNVAVYSHKEPVGLRQSWSGKTIHRAEEIRFVGVPAALVEWLASRLERRNRWEILRTEGTLYVTVNGDTESGVLAQGVVGSA